MNRPDAAALAMAYEIRRKNRRKAVPIVTSELIDEPESLEIEAEPDVAAPFTAKPVINSNIAQAIIARRKAAQPKPQDEIEELDFDEPEPAMPVKTSKDRLSAILNRRR